jgi:imidazolonepropionase-like amidohydrolase
VIDVGALSEQLQAAERTNRAIETRARYDKLKADRDAKQRQVDKLTRQMEARAEKKRAALGKAKIPVEGLTFDEREVKYNGIPIEMLGEGEQIRISTLIGMAANPKLRLLCIRHGEALDPDGLKQLAEMAKEHDFQIIMARVDTSGKVGVVIEDGSVIATNEE